MFRQVGEVYDQRYGLRYDHLARIAEINIRNARDNPLAQTRAWSFTPASFTQDDEANPVIDGMIRRQDCGQVTDGAAAVILAYTSVHERLGCAAGAVARFRAAHRGVGPSHRAPAPRREVAR